MVTKIREISRPSGRGFNKLRKVQMKKSDRLMRKN